MSTEIFLATKNKAKITDFKLYLGKSFTVKSMVDFDDLGVTVEEGFDSLAQNAFLKAHAYAKATGLIALGDDTGFFINELNGEPGVALKRWGGALPESITPEQLWRYLQEKTKHLTTITCYFEQCVAVVAPDGTHRIVSLKTHGILNREKLNLPFNGSDYPLARAFEATARPKTWDEMTDVEKVDFSAPFIADLTAAVEWVLAQRV